MCGEKEARGVAAMATAGIGVVVATRAGVAIPLLLLTTYAAVMPILLLQLLVMLERRELKELPRERGSLEFELPRGR